MRLVLEVAIVVMIMLAAGVIRALLANLEDDAFDAELTAISNERARLAAGRMREMNA